MRMKRTFTMNKILRILFLLLGWAGAHLSVWASEGTQVLYSINMPGNPFQQPYYQMMIKADNKNNVYPFTNVNQPQFYTFNACSNETGCGSYWDNQLNVTSDYVSVYNDSSNRLSLIYGLTPYTFRGYVEGAAATLFMQRPAQVQLPFNPLAQIQIQNQTTAVYVNATLPDYSDIFLSQTSANIYQSLKCTSKNCTIQNTDSPLPSWYTYLPRTGWVTRGLSVILYGTMASLYKPQFQTSFSPYSEPIGWSSAIGMGVSKMSSGHMTSDTPRILKEGVFSQKSWLTCRPPYSPGSFDWFGGMLFMPIISPGYAGDAQQYPQLCDGCNNPVNPLATVLATGDLSGNYSISNTNNPYIATGNPATTYDGISLNNGMSYFQLFAQNMQWFSLPASQSTPLPPLSSTIPQNITPGQGIFSDALQIAAMEAPLGTSQTPVFTGSVGVTAGITGPVLLKGAAPLPGSKVANPTNFTVPQAFLSEVTTQSFKVGNYLQVPLGTQVNGTWSGGLVQAATEDPLQYYQGVTPLESKLSLMPYVPLYFSDPGLQMWVPGGSYCPLSLFNQTPNAQLCYDTGTSPMTNFHSALKGMRGEEKI
jgi:hypothetical protein